MSLETYIAFVVTTVFLVLVPGPVVALTVAHSLAHGWRQTLVTVSGASLSIVVQLAITSLGLASILLVLSGWFEVVRWAAVAYLIYTGVQYWRAKPDRQVNYQTKPGSARGMFFQGFLVSSTNPKSLVFYAAFFPQFVNPAAPAAAQLIVLSVTFLAIFSGGVAGYAILAAKVRGRLQDPRRAVIRNRLVGGLMIGAGIGVAVARRGS